MKNNLRQEIQALIKEIEIHRSHSLFAEAKQKCEKLALKIRKSKNLKNKKRLLDLVTNKIAALEKDIHRFESAGASIQMSAAEQDVLKKLFHLPIENGNSSAVVAGADALLVFGQFEKALNEFNELIKEDSLKVHAAKNVLRCHMGLSSVDRAVSQYKEWFASGRFTPEELGKIHYFFKEILGKKEIDVKLPQPEGSSLFEEDGAAEEDHIDILSIMIAGDEKSLTETGFDLDVNFQRGDLISVIVPRRNKAFVENLKTGAILNDVMFFSTAVIFKDACVVSETKQIKSGPKKGDYTLVLKMV